VGFVVDKAALGVDFLGALQVFSLCYYLYLYNNNNNNNNNNNLRVVASSEFFLAWLKGTVSFSRRTVLRGFNYIYVVNH
jgi:hypothetical protein